MIEKASRAMKSGDFQDFGAMGTGGPGWLVAMCNIRNSAAPAGASNALLLDDLLDRVEVAFGAGIERVDLKHLPEGLGGILVTLHLGVHQPAARDGAEMPGFELERGGDVVERFLILAHL